MLTRRALFARLSAVALAPLVKLMPKEEAPTGYWAYLPPNRKRNWTAMPSSPVAHQEELNRLINNLMLKQRMQAEQQRLCRSLGIVPVPQEEA